MYKYTFKDFLNKDKNGWDGYNAGDYFTNSHIVLDRRLLTKSQNKVVEELRPQSDNMRDNIARLLDEVSDIIGDKPSEDLLFEPDLVLGRIEERGRNIFHDSDLNLSIREMYYNYIKARGCEIYLGEGKHSPTAIYKGNELVGILMPMRVDSVKGQEDYSEYIKSLK